MGRKSTIRCTELKETPKKFFDVMSKFEGEMKTYRIEADCFEIQEGVILLYDARRKIVAAIKDWVTVAKFIEQPVKIEENFDEKLDKIAQVAKAGELPENWGKVKSSS